MGAVFSSGRSVKVNEITSEDTIIFVIGPSGAGKSTFINYAANDQKLLPVNHKLKPSKTPKVQAVKCRHPTIKDKYVVFVDTPALDQDDAIPEVKNKLKIWIESLQEAQGRKTADGIIYLHKITDARMTDPPVTALLRFDNASSDHDFEKVLLVTTMWRHLKDRSIGEKREEEVRTKYWENKMEHGPKIHSFQETADSAWIAVNMLMNHQF